MDKFKVKAITGTQLFVEFEQLTVFGVTYRGNFTAVLEDGEWLPFRYEKMRSRKDWIKDALYMSRLGDVLYEPSSAARKKVAELALAEAKAWAADHPEQLVHAQAAELSQRFQEAAGEAARLEDEFNKAVEVRELALQALQSYKKEHGL